MCILRLWEFLMGELPCPPSPSAPAQAVITEKTTTAEKEMLIADYDDRLASYESQFCANMTWLDEDAQDDSVLVASMKDHFSTVLWSLSRLIRCGLFFEIAMSPLDSLLFLLLFVGSSFFTRVMQPLMLSSINFLLFGIRLTLLVINCLVPPVSHVRTRMLLLSFVPRMTS
jgi:hypothetical protein